MAKFSISTLGCKVNQYESQLIRENFLKNNFTEVNRKEPADIYIINTCTVTDQADRDSRRLIRHTHRLNPKARIVVTGCFIEKKSDIIREIEGVTDIVKNSDKDKIVSTVTNHLPLTICHSITGFKGHTKAFVKIQDGCNNFCSFCTVPLVRGRPKSRSIEEIRKEVAALLNAGFKEIVLSGICLGEWGKDLFGDFELTDVIEELENINRKFRIRLSSIELKYITDRLLKKMATSEKLCKHLHIPLQSGDNHILRAMNRLYSREEYLSGIIKIKSIVPTVGITTDILIGFPGESDKHFKATVGLLKKCKPHRMHIFSYSRREGTKAASLNDSVSQCIIKKRVFELRRIDKALSYDYRKNFLGNEAEVLIEYRRDKATQLLTGYTDNYIKVLLDGNDLLKGTLLRCRIANVTSNYTLAKI